MKKSLMTLACAVSGVALFMRYYPEFGKSPGRREKARFRQSKQFKNDRFVNEQPFKLIADAKTFRSILKDQFQGLSQLRPADKLPVLAYTGGEGDRVTWFGHSAFLLELEGVRVFFDPMLGTAPSPFPKIGRNRFELGEPFAVEKLPMLDAVVFSHDHYDHLDRHSIRLLKDRASRFIVPLGVGSRLIGWGVAPEKVVELDWHGTTEVNGLRFVCTPARHYSGRRGFDQYSTLWSSWVVKGKDRSVFYSGDSGYGPHFKEIGERYGPFDLTLMECGQYDPRWQDSHMLPEETVQAHLDVKGKLLVPVHWSAFTLAFHPWHEPVERALAAAAGRTEVATPRIGESVELDAPPPRRHWWRDVK
ncbi:MBL fold metallo-hydrolase [Exiguobacterium flavidum]|uniref:MBL fold metallo-hydrolase n=1 Tax=Exiguobacterium flavidum TaxID=2184695 RepID=UPI000DF8558F|nr:MBL fold metallo-hydrolase [Exiguobacterium flavidum]